MVTIIDYGVGNLYSLTCAFQHIGENCQVTSDYTTLRNADHLLLPGVGAFGDAIEKLHATHMGEIVLEHIQKGKPLLGICLGMQLLFEDSYEYGHHQGLGVFPGSVVRFDPAKIGSYGKIPHVGWNELEERTPTPLLKGIPPCSYVYYVHSYHVSLEQETVATTTYGDTVFTGIVQKENVFGAQFHPEKSGQVGLQILKNFIDYRGN